MLKIINRRSVQTEWHQNKGMKKSNQATLQKQTGGNVIIKNVTQSLSNSCAVTADRNVYTKAKSMLCEIIMLQMIRKRFHLKKHTL